MIVAPISKAEGKKVFFSNLFSHQWNPFKTHLDVIKKLHYLKGVTMPDASLEPDWDDDNIGHIAKHGLRPEQVEEVYYGEGPFPALGLKTKKRRGRATEHRYRLWGTDASGMCIEAIIAPYSQYGLWRCVTAFPMSPSTQKAYLRRIKK